MIWRKRGLDREHYGKHGNKNIALRYFSRCADQSQDKVAEGPVGSVGHCMSGRHITTAAARFPRMKAGTNHKLEVLPGTQHGFCFAERPVYHPVAAEHTWERVFDLWDRNSPTAP